MSSNKTSKRPAAQIKPAKKAAAVKAAAEAKRPQPVWLLQPALTAPVQLELPEAPERSNQAHPPRLMEKAEVLAITGVSYPSLWDWMRKGTFPRSRRVGGKSKWLSTEVEAWILALPIRRLKGDADIETAA